MNLSAIQHRPNWEYIYPSAGDKLEIRLVAQCCDARQVQLIYWKREEKDPACRRYMPMTLKLRDSYHDYFTATVQMDSIAAYTRYCFLIQSENENIWLGARGFDYTEPGMEDNHFEFLWPNAEDGFSAPEWSKEQVYYQIFPERFEKVSPELSPEDVQPWGSDPTRENFMGGDIIGITKRLDYIQSLGITCIYLNPIFKAPSNHKYDTVDYYSIDPHFGTEQDFKELVEQAHKRNIRVILDGVFNHCGYYWPPFQDVVKNGDKSPYKDWFFIHSYPVSLQEVNYDCVGHYKWMPKINLSNPEARKYFIDVGKYWVREFGTDGWRLDVADEVPMTFWEEFSYQLKQQSPNCILIGETWGDAQRLIAPGRLDSAMNYVFRDAVKDWLALGKVKPSGFDHMANRMLAMYPYETVLRMYNLIGSHDTPRFLTVCGEDERMFRLAVALQMTFPGCPVVYYGDEVAMTGENDPGCRGAMDWTTAEQGSDLTDWFKKLISLRRSSESLISGDFHTALCDDQANAYGYCRSTENETTLVLLNASAKDGEFSAAVPGGAHEWQEVFTGEMLHSEDGIKATNDSYLVGYTGRLKVQIPAYSIRIYKKRK